MGTLDEARVQPLEHIGRLWARSGHHEPDQFEGDYAFGRSPATRANATEWSRKLRIAFAR